MDTIVISHFPATYSARPYNGLIAGITKGASQIVIVHDRQQAFEVERGVNARDAHWVRRAADSALPVHDEQDACTINGPAARALGTMCVEYREFANEKELPMLPTRQARIAFCAAWPSRFIAPGETPNMLLAVIDLAYESQVYVIGSKREAYMRLAAYPFADNDRLVQYSTMIAGSALPETGGPPTMHITGTSAAFIVNMALTVRP